MSLILKPIVTEKTSLLREQQVFAFLVHQDANKIEITKEFKRIFNQDALDCRIVRIKKQGGRILRSRQRAKPYFVKKAYIRISKDIKLDGFEGI